MKKLNNIISRTLAGMLLVTVAAGQLWAAGDGTTGAPFLKIGTSARSEALGGAGIASATDVDAIYLNPAGLNRLQRRMIGFGHMEWFQDIRYEHLAYADKLESLGAVGLSLNYLHLGGIPKTLEDPAGNYDAASSVFFGASDLSIHLNWGRFLFTSEHTIGIGVKLIQQKIDQSTAFTFALDLGDQLVLQESKWFRTMVKEKPWLANAVPHAIGFSIRNLGPAIRFNEQDDPLPLYAGFGLDYGFFNRSAIWILDLGYWANESGFDFKTGLEYWVRTDLSDGNKNSLDLAPRIGFRSGYTGETATGLSLGFGARYGGLYFDYVFMPFGELGNTHRVVLKFAWGEPLPALAPITNNKERTVTRTVERGSRELERTAETMLETRKAIEGRTVVNLEQKGLEAQAEDETHKFKGIMDYKKKTLVEPEKLKDATALTMDKQAIIRGPQTKLDTDLVSKITGQKMANTADLPRTKYIRRSQADVIEAAQQEAEMRSKALGAVESAARVQADQVDRETLVTKTTVYFAPNSSALDKRYLFALDKIGESSKKLSKRAILVYGHASSDEAEPANLSLQRAKSVRDYLVQNLSLASDKITVKGFGDREPAMKEAQGRDKARNRRVWVQIIQSGN